MWVWQACSALSTSSLGVLVLGGKPGHLIGSVPRLPSPPQWEGVWASAYLAFVPRREYLFVGKTASPFVYFWY